MNKIEIPNSNLGLIVAVGKNKEIGYEKELLWKIKEDLAFFKEHTMGTYIIMGRNTFESMPPKLAGRRYIILSRNPNLETSKEHIICQSLDEVLSLVKQKQNEPFMVVGGGMIYKLFLPYVDFMHITEINETTKKANVFFPEFNENDWDRLPGKEMYCEENNVDYQHTLYLRKLSINSKKEV